MNIKPVAYIENDFKSKFAVPRQSGIASIKSKIIFEKEYCDENGVRGLDGFSHLWLIWGFSENEDSGFSLTVRPPRLGGNKRVGVFASRSPYRPNALGLSSVKLDKIELKNGILSLYVSGADLISGTPIYDIKPYIKFTDSHPNSSSGFVETEEFNILSVEIPERLMHIIPKEKRNTLITVLENDPRPAYHNDSNRVYGFNFSDFEIKFTVSNNVLKVTDIYER